ncbi:hypothetical protein [Corallococcus llansteffanensis]|uniref:DUF4013 domain-containing protein n=1 Tax=Corallococcus llansteffanensis TaxID=2316731 RepID=A0A3A8NYI5_9BACT|nr:hypothetical protein [Corallococcus llansteffanensis]RKH49298.1 hypothetical protein D7V93_32085 [Corallococcus llansteffanensis]
MMDDRIDARMKRSWDFFLINAEGLLLGGLVVLVGFMVLIPGPWFAFNLLQESLECARTGRTVRWQAAFDRPGNFARSWGLALAMGIPIVLGFALLIVPGVLLSLYWFQAPALAADGRRVGDALTQSGQLFRQRRDWTAYLLNWLVFALLCSLGGVTAVALALTVPLSLVYLVLCYTDETGPVHIDTPVRTHLPA